MIENNILSNINTNKSNHIINNSHSIEKKPNPEKSSFITYILYQLSFLQYQGLSGEETRNLGFFQNIKEIKILHLITDYLSIQELLILESAIQSPQEKKIIRDEIKKYTIDIHEWGDEEALRKKIPWPKELNDLMTSPDKDLYAVFPVVSFLQIDEKIVPTTTNHIETIANAKNPHSPANRIGTDIFTSFREKAPLEKKIRWAVITKTILPNSDCLTYEDQLQRHRNWTHEYSYRKGFDIPSATIVFFAICWHWQKSADHTLLYQKPHSTHCKEVISGCPLLVGSSSSTGISYRLNSGSTPIRNIGIGAIKIFS